MKYFGSAGYGVLICRTIDLGDFGMKRLGTIIAVMFIVVLTACSNPNRPDLRVTSPTQPSAERVQREAQEAIDTAGDYAAGQKRNYQSKVQSQLREFENNIDKLQSKASNASDSARTKLNDQIRALQAKRDDVANQLNELQNSSGNAWDKLTNGVDNAMKDLQRSYEQALNEFDQMSS